MRQAGIRGIKRGRRIITTKRDDSAPRAPDLVKRNFTASAPTQLWVTDLTNVPAESELPDLRLSEKLGEQRRFSPVQTFRSGERRSIVARTLQWSMGCALAETRTALTERSHLCSAPQSK